MKQKHHRPEDGEPLGVMDYVRASGWSRKTVYNLIKAGRLIAYKDLKGVWVIPWQGNNLRQPKGYITVAEMAKREGVTPRAILYRGAKKEGYLLKVDGQWFVEDGDLYTNPR